MSWVERDLATEPQSNSVVYIVDNETALHKVPINKGNEAMVYECHDRNQSHR
jgi:hypothetical protein